MSWLLGKHNQQVTPEDQVLLDKRKDALQHPNAKAEQAYLDTLEQERIKNAKAAAIRDANNLANQKPFYQKLIGASTGILRDLGQVAANTNPDALITFDDEPKRTRRKRRKR